MYRPLPYFIEKQFQQANFKGEIDSTVLFVDISGFTPLTETLMKHSNQAAETLSAILNRIFDDLVQVVYTYDGFISTFAGDAFTAIFYGENHEARARHVAQVIKHFFEQHPTEKNPYGTFDLKVKMGMASGDVLWEVIGQNFIYTYYFHGPAIRGAMSPLPDIAAGHIPPYTRPNEVPPPEQAILHKFVPQNILQARPEFRHTVNLFINFDAESGDWQQFVQHVLDTTTKYEGYFNKLDYSDKGSMILLVFGAPITHENDIQRAANCLQDLNLPDSGLRWRAGMTYGMAYAGHIGGQQRGEYTVIGSVVNRAARLASMAGWGEKWLDAPCAHALKSTYELTALGLKALTGVEQPQQVWQLQGRASTITQQLAYMDRMVGRVAELKQLQVFCQPIQAGRFAGVALITGEPGMGKSHLAAELFKHLQAGSVRCWVCAADSIATQPLYPFKQFLINYFEQSLKADADAFHNKLDDLINRTQDADLKATLKRSRPSLQTLLDLPITDAAYEPPDPQFYIENLFITIKSLLLAESRQQPILLYIEDAHWMDSYSLNLMAALSDEVDDYPIAILISTRPLRDDNSAVALPLKPDLLKAEITLTGLPQDEISQLARHLLGGSSITNALTQFIADKSKGNPLFVEQLTLYLRQEQFISRRLDGTFDLHIEGLKDIPDSINKILVAHFDRLPEASRELVKAASVLEQNFSLPLLKALMQKPDILAEMSHIIQAGIWINTDTPDQYTFRHDLMREAIYHLQPPTEKQSRHQHSARTLQAFYTDPAAHYGEIAWHYRQAGAEAEELHYIRLAADYASRNYLNAEAAAHLKRAIALTPPQATDETYQLMLKREHLLDLLGERAAQSALLDDLMQQAEQTNNLQWQSEVLLRRVRYLEVTGQFEAVITLADQALTMARQAGAVENEIELCLSWGRVLTLHFEHEAAKARLQAGLELARRHQLVAYEAEILNQLGTYYRFISDIESAEEYITQALSLFKQQSNEKGQMNALKNLGLLNITRNQINDVQDYFQEALPYFEKIGDQRSILEINIAIGELFGRAGDMISAEKFLSQALRPARAIKDRRAELKAAFFLGNIMMLTGRFDDMERYYSYAFEVASQLGDKILEINIKSNLGLAARNQGHYSKALSLANEALKICDEDAEKNKFARSNLLNNLGDIYRNLGDFETALTYYQEAIRLYQEITDLPGEANSYICIVLLYHHQGQMAQAQAYADKALAIIDKEMGPYEYAGVMTYTAFMDTENEEYTIAQEKLAEAAIIREHNQEHTLLIEIRAQQALLAHKLGDLAGAMAYVEMVLPELLDSKKITGAEDPMRVYLNCYRVLIAQQDSRAEAVFDAGYKLLLYLSEHITDPDLRYRFTENIPSNKTLLSLKRKKIE